ncbi:MAG TPA: GGDEF domain-containing protein [Thermoleophilaceae bacterium]
MGPWRAIREALARRDDPYAGGDIALARKLGRIIAMATTAIALVLLPLAPPTASLGARGWAVVGALVLLSIGSVASERAVGGGFDWNQILFWNYVGVFQVATAQWLAGSHAPYRQLFLLTAVYVGGVHPPRRVLPFLGLTAAVTVGPLFFDPWDPLFTGETFALVMIWSALTLVASVANTRWRLHRLGGLQAERLARADALTGLGNRRAFDEALTAEIARARRLGSPLSLLLADLNQFKPINDRHGHLAGDHCLRLVAVAFRDEIRLHDRCFRWGGDEFAAILADSDGAVAELVAERVTSAVEERCRQPDGEPLTLGAAYAELRDSMTADDLVAAADAALLELKSARPTAP